MKKFLLAALLVLGMSSMYGQGVFKVGAVLALPTGDASDVSSFGLGADVYYMFGKEDAWLNFGPTVGLRYYFGKETEISSGSTTITVDADDVQFLPLAGAFRAKAFGLLNWGADIGYAVGLGPDGNDGGFYLRPIAGIDIADTIEVNASYELISLDGGNWNALTFGILFEFGK
jgi:hypothetical protein